MYPKGMRAMSSYLESRGGEFSEVGLFGVKALVDRLNVPFTKADIDECATDFAEIFGTESIFDRSAFNYILSIYRGKFPVEIKALPEGQFVPVKNAILTIESVDANVPWVANYLETIISHLWYPSTVMTRSREMKKIIYGYLEKTGDIGGIDYKLHDFGFRGATGIEAAAIGGAAHLMNFRGSDTAVAIKHLKQYYGVKTGGQVCNSIPASEHSTITSWGGPEHEMEAVENIVDRFSNLPGIFAYACVADSYDVFNFCRQISSGRLKEKIQSGRNTFVVRPDSGDPVAVSMECLKLLGDAVGYETNFKGYKVLHPKYRMIYGDGMNRVSINDLYGAMEEAGWSADNMAVGMGAGLLQKLDRDTQKFAIKCSSIRVGDEDRDVFKNPITDPGKASKKGRLKLVVTGEGKIETVREGTAGENLLQTVYHPVVDVRYEPSFQDIKKRAELKI
jgi:nicotinamide phosphoribosyltransferase